MLTANVQQSHLYILKNMPNMTKKSMLVCKNENEKMKPIPKCYTLYMKDRQSHCDVTYRLVKTYLKPQAEHFYLHLIS